MGEKARQPRLRSLHISGLIKVTLQPAYIHHSTAFHNHSSETGLVSMLHAVALGKPRPSHGCVQAS